HRFDLRFKLDLHALLAKDFFKLGGDFFVFERHHSRQRFEERDVCSEGFEDRSEFDADSAAADYDHRLGNLLKTQNFAVRQHNFAVDFKAWERTRFGARGEHRVSALDLGTLAVFFHGDASGPGDTSPAGDGLDFILFEQSANPAGVFFDDLVF